MKPLKSLLSYFKIVYTLLFQVYKDYESRFFRKVLKRTPMKPWMREREIQIIQEILRKLEPERVLEWGSGYSSLYFPQFLGKTNARWLSVEHDKDWYSQITVMNQNPKVDIVYVPPNQYPFTDSDGTYADLKDYVDFPSQFEGYDFILVDGRARRDCLVKAYDLLRQGGVVVLHDANRTPYHEPFQIYPHQALFRDYRQSEGGGLWVGNKDTILDTIFDVKKHLTLWRIYHRFGNVIELRKLKN